MKNKLLIISIFLVFGTIQNIFSQTYLDSQKQNNEYKNLHDATTRAYATPASSNSQNSSSANSGSSTNSSSTSSASSSSVTDYNFNTAPRLNLNSYDRDQAKIQKNNEKQQAIYDTFDAKEKKWRELMVSSGLEKNGKNFEKFVQMGVNCGLELWTCMRMLGGSPEGYDQLMNKTSERNDAEFFTGSTKSDCSGDCTETLDYAKGTATYVGNTKNGTPQGRGTLSFNNGTSLSANFNHGNYEGDVVLKYQDGAIYEGGYLNDNWNGFGTLSDAKVTSSGYYKNGLEEKKGQRTYVFISGQKKVMNYDVPSKSVIEYSEGTKFVGILDDISYNMKIGKKVSIEKNYTTEGYYDASGQLNGYGKYTDSNGNITEATYTAGQYSGSIIFTFKSGEVLTGVGNVNGYKMYGVYKTLSGEKFMKGLTEVGWVEVPPSENENMIKIYNEALTVISKARSDYELALK